MVCAAVADLKPYSIRPSGSFGNDEADQFAGLASNVWEDAEEEHRSQNMLRESRVRRAEGAEKKNPARYPGGVL